MRTLFCEPKITERECAFCVLKNRNMGYLPEERETLIRYDELDNCWYFESNVRRHVTKILKMEHAFDSVEKRA